MRAYFDICSFHPFADGNARAARLALDRVLTRAGLGLHAIEPLITIARSTDDVPDVYTMTEMLRLLAGPPARADGLVSFEVDCRCGLIFGAWQ